MLENGGLATNGYANGHDMRGGALWAQQQLSPEPVHRAEIVQVQNLARVWANVRPGLEAVIKKTHPTWIPEDVYHLIMIERVWLILSYTDEEYTGFAIVGYELDQFTKTTCPMVWIAWTKHEVPGQLKFVLDSIAERAKQMGHNYLIMHSPRPGWRKLGPKLGFHIRDVVYGKEL